MINIRYFKLPVYQTYFLSSKGVWAIEVLLYLGGAGSGSIMCYSEVPSEYLK